MEFLYENVQHIASYTDPLLHNAIRLFQGCSDKSSLMKNPALSIQAALDEIHLSEWPYDEEPLDLEIPEVLALAARKLGVHPFFVSSLEVDTTTSSGWIFVFKEPRTVIPGDAYLFEDFPVKYQKLVTKAMSFVNSDKNIQAMSEPVVEVDHEVFRILEKTKRVTDYTVEYYRKKLAQVNKKKDFDMGLFLTSLMSDITVLDSDTEFVEAAPNLLQHVQNLTASFNKIAVLNYVGFRALLSLSPLLPHNDGRDLAHLLYVREIPTRTSSKRWKFCIRLLENVYKLPLLQLQAESFEKKDTFQTINRTVELLKKYFFRQIRNSSHFGHDTKDIVINKLRLLKMECFNSHHISNHEARERHYHGVPDIDPSNVLSDYTQTLIVVLQNYWSSYGGTGSLFRWHGSIFDTEATYDHFDNTLYIPMAVFMEDVKYNTFHSPLYFPRSGRRIMEALYTMIERDASFFGRNNEVTASSYWDYVTLNGYLSLRRCLKKQFQKKTPSRFPSSLMNAPNPSMKLSQDVKDNAVLQIVLEAFREAMLDFGYKPGGLVLPEFTETTTDQLFFLLYSTSYCEVTTQEAQMADDVSSTSHPRRSRVNLSLRNIPAFATAFACTNVTEMNPTKKCRSW
ncbi:neprilysin-11-like [Ixodes scapularis]|uniref:neprilysin-11-like n=1 Tax=Ixodes scapularis TaxID=6945 RepID=UPI001C3907FE|nr:neprilysin-11-like [Ixodes scapularis]